jgi:hypothetical protein
MYEIHVTVAAIRVQNKTFADICSKVPITDIFYTRRRRDTVFAKDTEKEIPVVAATALPGGGSEAVSTTLMEDDIKKLTTVAEPQWKDETTDGSISAIEEKSTVGEAEEHSTVNEDHYDSLWRDYDYDADIKANADKARSQVRIDFVKYGKKKAENKQEESEKVELPDDIYCDLVNSLNDKCLQSSLLSIWKYNRFVVDTADSRKD